MNNAKIAVQVKQIKDPDGNEVLMATIPMALVFGREFDAKQINEELKKFEDEYFKLVDSLKSILKLIRARERKGKVLLYWMLGDEIYEFTERSKDDTLFMENPIAHLVRDTGASEKMVNRCKKFRSLYPNISEIDLSRSFNSYIEKFEGGYVSAKRREERKAKGAKDA
jgi:hypothetical protein